MARMGIPVDGQVWEMAFITYAASILALCAKERGVPP
jgi:hypothetical protein